MKQTPIHDNYNPDLLRLIPKGLGRIVEVGCSSGALAKAYLNANPECEYIGIEIDSGYAEISAKSCSRVICGDIEKMTDKEFSAFFPSDCWIFGDTLEHLYDPWAVLRRIRAKLTDASLVVACIPNAQHWSIQASLSCGLFRYQDQGLMDRTHIRWFTRTTIIELFASTGYKIVEGFPRVFEEPERERILPSIRAMAIAAGADPQIAVNDAIPLQWIVKAVPAD